jgi:SpoVK/Ycf46/Vps4 family AAA+-type ATPase
MTIPELIRDLSFAEAKRFDSANLEASHLLAVLAYRFMIKYDVMDRARAVSKKSHGKSSFHGTVVISDELDQLIDSCKTKDDIAKAYANLKLQVLFSGENDIAAEDDFEEIDFETAFAELEQLVGLASVKERLKKVFATHQANQKRIEKGLEPVELTNHLVFTGSPGTGKTTVARIVAKLYKTIGVLPKGHLVETGRQDLVGGYIGQTAIKTKERIDEAMGGVLFIDEAYTLTQYKATAANDFGAEAIATLLKEMEDHRGEFAVIAAGYTKEMAEFVLANPGLKSRFSTVIDFPDYSPSELLTVFKGLCAKNVIGLPPDVEKLILKHFESTKTTGDAGNARYVRSLFENMFGNMSLRASESTGPIQTAAIESFQVSDFPDAQLIKTIAQPFGFVPVPNK